MRFTDLVSIGSNADHQARSDTWLGECRGKHILVKSNVGAFMITYAVLGFLFINMV